MTPVATGLRRYLPAGSGINRFFLHLYLSLYGSADIFPLRFSSSPNASAAAVRVLQALAYSSSIYSMKFLPYSRRFRESQTFFFALTFLSGGIVFDIGANVGNHAVYWAIKRRAYKVYAFEPVLSTFSLLETNIALNLTEKTIIPLNYAISDHIGKVSIGKVDLQNIGATESRFREN
jgi:hypothetical protein